VRTIIDAISRLLSLIAGVAILYIMVITIADVTRRNVLDGRSIPAAVEYAEVLLVAIAYLSLAFAQRQGGHIAVGLLTDRLPTRVAASMRLVAGLFGTAILTWAMVATWQLGLQSMDRGEYRQGLIGVPIWPVRLIIPIGLGLLILQFMFNLLEQASAIWSGMTPPHKQQQSDIPPEV
jgi:TRAP-type C4-dicarboxylate transport system permease small subunit